MLRSVSSIEASYGQISLKLCLDRIDFGLLPRSPWKRPWQWCLLPLRWPWILQPFQRSPRWEKRNRCHKINSFTTHPVWRTIDSENIVMIRPYNAIPKIPWSPRNPHTGPISTERSHLYLTTLSRTSSSREISFLSDILNEAQWNRYPSLGVLFF